MCVCGTGWGKCCVQWFVSEVQGEGNVVYSDVCLRYRVRKMLCTVMCVWGTGWGKCCVQWCVSEVQGEGNVVYSNVCLRYRVREMLCTVMCVWGTGWGKCCVQWCVSEVQGEGKFTVQLSVVGFGLQCEYQLMDLRYSCWQYGDCKYWNV